MMDIATLIYIFKVTQFLEIYNCYNILENGESKRKMLKYVAFAQVDICHRIAQLRMFYSMALT